MGVVIQRIGRAARLARTEGAAVLGGGRAPWPLDPRGRPPPRGRERRRPVRPLPPQPPVQSLAATAAAPPRTAPEAAASFRPVSRFFRPPTRLLGLAGSAAPASLPGSASLPQAAILCSIVTKELGAGNGEVPTWRMGCIPLPPPPEQVTRRTSSWVQHDGSGSRKVLGKMEASKRRWVVRRKSNSVSCTAVSRPASLSLGLADQVQAHEAPHHPQPGLAACLGQT